jgi:hypothetical protein
MTECTWHLTIWGQREEKCPTPAQRTITSIRDLAALDFEKHYQIAEERLRND